MEDYTYNLVPGKEGILQAHMLEVCPIYRRWSDQHQGKSTFYGRQRRSCKTCIYIKRRKRYRNITDRSWRPFPSDHQ